MNNSSFDSFSVWFSSGAMSGDPLLDSPLSVVSEIQHDEWHNEDRTRNECVYVNVALDGRDTRFYFANSSGAQGWIEMFKTRQSAIRDALSVAAF
jgi:hypothetical protein